MENKMVVDTHTHYAHPKFDSIRSGLLETLPKQGITAVVEAAIGYASNHKMLELCEYYSYMYAAVGVHPNFVNELDEEKFEELKGLLTHEKVVAIGETGLDYSKNDDEKFIESQKKWFARFIELSLEYSMPLVIHCRDSYEELLEIMSNYKFGENPGIIHCFSGNTEQAEKFISMGFLIGIGGKFLKKMDENQAFRDTIKKLPLEKIVLETDAPYLKPDALPGKYNTSLNLMYIVQELAKLKGIKEELIYKASWDNSMNFIKKD